MQPKVWQLSAAPEGHSHPVPCSSHQDNKGGKEGAGSVKSTGDKLGLRTGKEAPGRLSWCTAAFPGEPGSTKDGKHLLSIPSSQDRDIPGP